MKRTVLAVLALCALFAPAAHSQGVPAEIAALKAQVAALQSQVKALQTELAAVQSNKALALGPFVSVDPNPENGVRGPNIRFHGANIHIESGSGATNDNGTLLGLGNLFIGYNEPSQESLYLPANGPRMGSHNLIIGKGHVFSNAFGCLVAGEGNNVQGEGQSILGGTGNFIQALNENGSTNRWAVVVGGLENLSEGNFSVAVGGYQNVVNGEVSVALGGVFCWVNGFGAVALGGIDDRGIPASDQFSVTSFNNITVVQH